MKKRLRNIFSALFLSICTAWVIYYFRAHVEDFKIIFDLSWLPTALLALVIVAESFSSGLFTKAAMEHFNIRLNFNEWYGLSVVTRFWNIILPFRGGAGVRALYLKKIHAFPLTDFFATLLSLYFLIFLVNAVIGIACIILLYIIDNIFLYPLLFFFFAVALTMGFFVFFSPRISGSRYTLINKLSRAANAWHGIRKNYPLMKQLTLITLLNSAVGLFTVYFSYSAFGTNLSIFQSLLISTLFNFTAMINITPGSLGIVESIMILTAKLFEISPAESLLAAGLIRAVHMILMFLLGVVFNYRLGLKIRDQVTAPHEVE